MSLEALVRGVQIENAAGLCFLHTEAIPLAALRGPHPLGALLDHSPTLVTPLFPNFHLDPAHNYTQAIFLDTETTGLGGGAGVYCFMVGVGTFERLEVDPQSSVLSSQSLVLSPQSSVSHFVIRQFFMRHPGEEGALLLALAELLDRHGMSVTFNGRSFDLPLLRGRLQHNQRIYGDLRGSGRLLAPERPHLDLLHPARKIWRRRLQSCRLIHLEEALLGIRRSEEDVPGSLIPQLYQDYVRSGDAGEMRRIFYHNQEDILSMVGLATHLSRVLAVADERPLEREDWLSLGQCLEGQGAWAEAEAAYRRAIELVRDPAARGLAFSQLAALLKRQSRWAEAAELWERWLTTVPGSDLTPYIELAKYCEWRLGELDQAAMWTQWAIHTVRAMPVWQQPAGVLHELERRLARILRKSAAQPSA
jgi:uncharacterized protein YprB with RNaseH-like and TPR domain